MAETVDVSLLSADELLQYEEAKRKHGGGKVLLAAIWPAILTAVVTVGLFMLADYWHNHGYAIFADTFVAPAGWIAIVVGAALAVGRMSEQDSESSAERDRQVELFKSGISYDLRVRQREGQRRREKWRAEHPGEEPYDPRDDDPPRRGPSRPYRPNAWNRPGEGYRSGGGSGRRR